MLLRAYRVTDKIGVIVLKLSAALVDATLNGLSVVSQALLIVLMILLRILRVVLLPLTALLGMVARRNGGAGSASGGTSMARRASGARLDVAPREDPLKAQNRALNGLTLILLVALVVVLLWATNPARTNPGGTLSVTDAGLSLNAEAFASANTPSAPTQVGGANLIASPFPTASPVPELLQVRGTIAYTAREGAQTDIWVIPVDARTPLRLTNSPVDERDPVWSPDGRRLAYAGREAGETDDNWELYVYDVNASQTTRLTYDLSFQGAPDWSLDGQFLVYESYQGNNLDIFIVQADGRETPIRLPANSDAPDFAPAWSPSDGRRIAFVSWRDGNQDIYVFSLDEQSVVNLTNTPDRHEDFPVWSPDGNTIAYSALDEGLEKVFVKAVNDPNAPAQVIGRGRTPAWSPDGQSVIAAIDSIDSTQFVAIPFGGTGVVTPVFQVQSGANSPSWTEAPLPRALVNAGGVPAAITDALYIEQEQRLTIDPPFRLSSLTNVVVDQSSLSERVNDSFNALRRAALEQVGWDVLGRLGDAFWEIDRPPARGEEIRSWFKTGRAFGLLRLDIVGNPPPLEIVREDIGVQTYWRVYIRVAEAAQSGQLGEPLRQMPWDFTSRTAGDVEAYDQGGRLKSVMPPGYYVDLTQLAEDYGWGRLPVGSDWRANINSANYWLFIRSDGLTWYDAMRELYTEGALFNFAPTPIPAPPLPTAESSTGEG